jgi:hypothetical protein
MSFGKYYERPWYSQDEEMVFPDTLLLFHELRALRVNMCTNITRLLPEIYQLKKLKELEMTLYEIGPEIRHWAGLEHLVIFGMRSPFPPEFAALKNLNYLYVSNDSITTVPLEIYQLTSLRELQLSMDNIDSMPEGIAGLSKLEKLEVHRCGLKKMPDDVGKLSNLKELAMNLSLEVDWAKEFPKLAQLSMLKKLIIEYPGMKNIPEEIGMMDQVNYLKINTKKEDFDTVNRHLNYVAGMESLEELDLSLWLNYTKSMGKFPDAIRAMKNLRILRLSYSDLNEIPDWLNELPKLEKIDFQGYFSSEKKQMIRKKLDSRIQIFYYGSKDNEDPRSFSTMSWSEEKSEYTGFLNSMKTGDTLELYYRPKLFRSHTYGTELTIVKTDSGYEAIEEVIEGFHFKRTGWMRYPIKEKELNALRKLDSIKSYKKDRSIPVLSFRVNGRYKKISHEKLKEFYGVYRNIMGK